ncbi:MHJ_0274 family protein [Mycoplasmopsis felis]|uniref:MHJ_0274 family protein n=1 Tax=Mycoplasmopsis felis TaxID=33923 RepID=UPI002AFFE312|nr:hypothetical protein [Mycoplasmopsis felis]WQQ07285.1 hypothetical protein RRG37_01550 [Mycoplasmopsis felis]WQQ10325.1 hypothetical protein RRG49_01120 [Mycoplasmopsis felis]
MNNQTFFSAEAGNIIIWVVLAIILCLLIVYFLYQFIKGKIEKKRTKQATEEFEKNSSIYWYEIVIKINKLILLNKYTHDNFVPSIGKYTMSEINRATKNVIDQIFDEYEFKNFILQNPKFQKEIQELDMLRDLNSNLWQKKLEKVLTDFNNYEETALNEAKNSIRTSLENLKTKEELNIWMEQKYYSSLNKIKESNNE